MISHHSVAILRSDWADLADFRVCEPAVAISEAQRREIAEMHGSSRTSTGMGF